MVIEDGSRPRPDLSVGGKGLGLSHHGLRKQFGSESGWSGWVRVKVRIMVRVKFCVRVSVRI
jgi:hypothetical protein